MRRLFLAFNLLAATSTLASAQEAISFKAADGVVVHGEHYGENGARGVALAFHMAGSNKAEYAPIAPRLVRDGFEVIAIDQRSGGTLWGRPNETVKGVGSSSGYTAALPDLEATLKYAAQTSQGRPILVIGSSYSASLVLMLASRHPELAAVAAFSPGEYFDGVLVKSAAAQVSSPLFTTSASDPHEIAEAKALTDASPAKIKRQYVPEHGVHAASTLRTDRNPRGAEAAWQAFDSFLNTAIPRR